MLKKKLVSLTALLLAAVLMVEMMPAEGVRAAAAVAQKVFVTILEPSMVYESVYGFINGVATVKDKDEKYALIDTTGKEIVQRGKYKNISITTVSKSMVVVDNSNHAYIMDYAEHVQHDLGVCSSASIQKVRDNASGQYAAQVVVETETSYKYFGFDGTLKGEQPKGSSGSSNVIGKLTETGKYTNVSETYSNGQSYYIATIEDSAKNLRTYEIFDSSMNKTATIENADSYDDMGGYIKARYREEVIDGDDVISEYKEELVTYNGKVIINRGEEFNRVKVNYYSGTVFIRFDSKNCWKEIDASGNILGEYADYDDIEAFASNEYLMVSKYVYDNDDIKCSHYYLISRKDNSMVDIGESKGITSEYINKNYCIKVNTENYAYSDKPGYKLLDLKGNVVFDSSKYKGLCDGVEIDGRYLKVYSENKDAEGNVKGYSKCVIYNMDGTEFFNVGECEYIGMGSSKIYVHRMNQSEEIYDMNKNLICVYDYAKYTTYGYEYDGYIPVRSQDGKWGIVRLIANPALATPAPAVTATPAPAANNNAAKTPAAVKAHAKVKAYKVAAGKKKVTVTLPKLKNGVKGYKVEYSLKKNFKKSGSLTKAKSKVVIKKLKSKKTYYVRVKAYKLNGKKKVFSKKWSAVKKVKVK